MLQTPVVPPLSPSALTRAAGFRPRLHPQLPERLSDRNCATWCAALMEIQRCVQEQEANLCLQYCTGYLQALLEGEVIRQADHDQMRAQLLSVWLDAVQGLRDAGH